MTLRNLGRGILCSSVSVAAFIAAPALAQDAPPPPPSTAAPSEDAAAIVVTGSRIKQDPTKSALPLQIISTDDLPAMGLPTPNS